MLPSSCVTPAGTSIEVQNEWEENTKNTLLMSEALYVGFPTGGLLAGWVSLGRGGAVLGLVELAWSEHITKSQQKAG